VSLAVQSAVPREEDFVAKQNGKSELEEAQDLIAYGEKEGRREEMIGKIIFWVMGAGFLVAVVFKLMGKI
jgi:hypothetical protein